jgi:broad specificity phosphatase PhoE
MDKKNIIYLIRHAQSMYNVKELEASAGHTSFEAFRYTPELFDAKLSDFGIEQAKKAA